MKSLRQFCIDHPVMVACTISAILSAAVATVFWIDTINETIGERPDRLLIVYHFIVLFSIPALWWAAIKATKSVALILAAAMLLGVPRVKAAPVLVIGVVLVVVVGGVVGCKIVKRCSKIAKKRENGLTNEQFMVAGEADTHAALLVWTEEGYCAAERMLPVVPTKFTMCPVYVAPGETRVLTRADRGHEFMETWNEFEQEVSSYDLFLSRPVSYSKNGHRCEAEQSIISFSPSRTVKVGSGGLFYVIQRSNDLKTWTTILTLAVEPWMSPRIEECSDDDQQFYRIGAVTL